MLEFVGFTTWTLYKLCVAKQHRPTLLTWLPIIGALGGYEVGQDDGTSGGHRDGRCQSIGLQHRRALGYVVG